MRQALIVLSNLPKLLLGLYGTHPRILEELFVFVGKPVLNDGVLNACRE